MSQRSCKSHKGTVMRVRPCLSLLLGLLGLLAPPVWSQNITSNLIAHWPLDETGAAATFPDLIGTATGTRSNGTAWLNPGKVGAGAASFQPSGAFGITTDIAALAGAAQLSVTAWVRMTTLTGFIALVSQENYSGGFTNTAFNLYWDGTSLRYGLTSNGTTFVEAFGGTLPVGTWAHVAGTYDGANIRVYIDGALVGGPVAKTGTLFDSTLTVFLGADRVNGSAADPCICDMDDVRIYTRGLTQADIQALPGMSTAAASKRRPMVY
jgi:Concanavalin A-like lectin/glucanases superfamily